MMTTYKRLGDIVTGLADVLAPPERITVSESASRYRKLNNRGSYIGDWKNEMNMAMKEPMDVLTARIYRSMVFVGPAQSGKTEILLNWVGYSVVVDPMDMAIYSPTQAAARDFSSRRIDRMHKDSPKIGEKLSRSRDSDNKHDKHYKSGVILTLSWPSITELAGKPIGRVAITDYDRIPDDFGGEGNAFELARKRTTSFRSFAMTVAESSPSREVKDARFIRKTPHEAPPTDGILNLYNMGDRRRWYWPCLECGNYFEGNFRHLVYDTDSRKSPMERAETVRMVCPHQSCGHHIHPDERYAMQLRGHWLADGQSIDKDGVIYGEPPRSDIASFWLNGVAAMFTTWSNLVTTYIRAEESYERTGSEEALKTFYNTDLGEPFTPKNLESQRAAEDLHTRKELIGGTRDRPAVPPGVRFLVPTIDVQSNGFKVQVHGISPGTPFDITIVDRYSIELTDGRRTPEGKGIVEGRKDSHGQIAWLKPGAYQEDWDLIRRLVLEKAYPLDDDSGRHMSIKIAGCDSGGEAGVTTRAYQFYRDMKKAGHAGRFHLIKGDPNPAAPRARITRPDSNDRANKAAAQGDVPVLMLASNKIKDELDNRLESLTPGSGLIRFPHWLPDWFYEEMVSETRTDKGWEKVSKRNEAWDLLYYCIGLCISPLLNLEKIDWTKPPSWAAEWPENSLITAKNAPNAFASGRQKKYDFAALGEELA